MGMPSQLFCLVAELIGATDPALMSAVKGIDFAHRFKLDFRTLLPQLEKVQTA